MIAAVTQELPADDWKQIVTGSVDIRPWNRVLKSSIINRRS
jgi:hypothetical protein